MGLDQILNSVASDQNAGISSLPSSPSAVLVKSLDYVFGAAGIILVFNLISSGFKMMTSRGDPKALAGAQAKLTTSAIGVVILMASFWIVQLILKFFNINFTTTLI